MTSDLCSLECWLGDQLAAYAFDLQSHLRVRYALAVAMTGPLDDLTGRDIREIDRFLKRALSLLTRDPFDYSSVFTVLAKVLIAAPRGRLHLVRAMYG